VARSTEYATVRRAGQNSTVLSGDSVEEVSALKELPGRDFVVTGSQPAGGPGSVVLRTVGDAEVVAVWVE
jgi:hypothetical protein